MRTMPGESDCLLTLCPNPQGLTLLRCETACAHVVVPDAVEGQPITQMGAYAFSTRCPVEFGPAAFQVHLYTQTPDAAIAHDAAAIVSVWLPQFLTNLGNYAFFNCTRLEQLHLGPQLAQVGTDAFMNCFRLRRLTIYQSADQFRGLRGLLREYSGQLECAFVPAQQPECHLLFPSFDEEYEEMAAPHIFHYNIAGTGYLYRQCFEGDALQMSQYDAAFDLLLRTHSFELAVTTALLRLVYPVQLGQAARQQYLDCLAQQDQLALDVCLAQRNTRLLAFLLGQKLCSPQALAHGCQLARTQGNTQALSLLLEQTRTLAPKPTSSRFSL
ncbi:leucine-rich repeat protein [uncultured Allofournierella sp.]|uniref:leucine-rich repeat protein n=1 Tax=uncultured Allofournierella sp. TaxID=1940258 RepID=UPI0037500702